MGCDTDWRELPFTAVSPNQAQWQIAILLDEVRQVALTAVVAIEVHSHEDSSSKATQPREPEFEHMKTQVIADLSLPGPQVS